jgi:hypothetical protein
MSRQGDSWSMDALISRIADAAGRKRYAGGSPDATDIGLYDEGLNGLARFDDAVVLGMTPELRSLAARRFGRVLVVDGSENAIALYRDWLEPDARRRETIQQSDWMDLGRLADRPVQAVLGDGIFGNLPDVGAHRALLEAIRSMLAPGGRFVTRMALIPRDFDPVYHGADALLRRFRDGRIDEAEFGFGTRLVGHYRCCYDPGTFILDNGKLFAECAAVHAEGRLSADEHRHIRRYYFSGNNCILPQELWERLLCESGFGFSILRGDDKEWRAYYPVYVCIPR